MWVAFLLSQTLILSCSSKEEEKVAKAEAEAEVKAVTEVIKDIASNIKDTGGYSLQEQIQMEPSEESNNDKCITARETRSDLLSLIKNIENIKNYIDDRELGAAESYCDFKLESYEQFSKTYNIMNKLCFNLIRTHNYYTSENTRIPDKEAVAVLSALEDLEKATNRAEQTLSTAEQEIKGHCISYE